MGFSTSTANTAGESVLHDLGSFLASFLPEVLTVFAGLVALGIALHYVRKYVAGRKV